MGRVFTCLVVTHTNSRTSKRSTRLSNPASLLLRTLLYRVPHLSYPRNDKNGKFSSLFTTRPGRVRDTHRFGYQFRPVEFSAHDDSRPVSCYAIFKGLLLLSQPPGCLCHHTSFTTELILGTLAYGVGYFPFDDGTSLSPSHSRSQSMGIRRLPQFGGPGRPPHRSSALPPMVYYEAAPKGISRRTSYLRVRLAFHSYPQVIPASCDTLWFGPPVEFLRPSPCPWIAHPVSGLVPATMTPYSDSLSLRLRVKLP